VRKKERGFSKKEVRALGVYICIFSSSLIYPKKLLESLVFLEGGDNISRKKNL
jgi:hypothetical protein